MIEAFMASYADFQGRTGRGAFWRFVVLIALIFVGQHLVHGALNLAIAGASITSAGRPTPVIARIFQIANPLMAVGLFLPCLAALIRRLHDSDRTGWLAVPVAPALFCQVTTWFLTLQASHAYFGYIRYSSDLGYRVIEWHPVYVWAHFLPSVLPYALGAALIPFVFAALPGTTGRNRYDRGGVDPGSGKRLKLYADGEMPEASHKAVFDFTSPAAPADYTATKAPLSTGKGFGKRP
jgi:uncharacterized membrane protein YhaH (DUF805 family)